MAAASTVSLSERLLSGRALRWSAVLLLVLWAGLAAAWVVGAATDPDHHANDFLLFWSAGRMADGGRAAQAYAADLLLAVQREVSPGQGPGLIWPYPPPTLLLVRPLAALPFWSAMAAAAVAGLTAYALTIRAIVPDRWTVPVALAFPGAFVALHAGQTGLFVAAAVGAGLWLCDRRPWLAGVLLGLAVCKPQFGVLLPLILIGSGRWRTAASTGGTAAALCLASAAMFGLEPWRAFARSLSGVSAAVAGPEFPLWRMPSIFVTAFGAGLPAPAALAAWGAVAASVAAVTVIVWRRRQIPHALKTAVAAAAILLTTPYLWDYDTPLLAVSLAGLVAYGRERRLGLGERWLFVLLALGPVGLASVGRETGVQIASLALLAGWAGLAAVAWRAGREARETRSVMSQGLAFTAA